MGNIKENVKVNVLFVYLTKDCNLRCPHCFGDYGTSKETMDEKTLLDIIN